MAIASRPPANPPLPDRTSPRIHGPKYPPRLARELITAIATAAVEPFIRDVAIAQNGPTIASAPIMPKLIPPTTTKADLPLAASARDADPMNAANAVCQRLSPDRSEWRPTQTIATAVSTYGTAATAPMAKCMSPARLRIVLGSHHVTPYIVDETPQ